MSEYFLVTHTSACVHPSHRITYNILRLTLSIGGIFKEIATISVAILLFGEHMLSSLNLLGLSVSIAGIAYYNVVKYRYVCVCMHAWLFITRGREAQHATYSPVATRDDAIQMQALDSEAIEALDTVPRWSSSGDKKESAF